LDAQSTEEAAFDDDDLRTLQGMADMVAVALDNARLFAETRRSVRQQQLVTRITERLQQASSMADILSLTAADLGETFDLAQATVCLGTAAEFQNPSRLVQDTE
jgi:GAF domain-containing protein